MNQVAAEALTRAAERRMISLPPLSQEVEPVTFETSAPPVVAMPVKEGRQPMYMRGSRDADKFVVRLPDGMRAEVARRGGEDDRSMNGVIIQALRKYLDDNDELALQLDAVAALKAQLVAQLAALGQVAPE
jgi:hypothetical protein